MVAFTTNLGDLSFPLAHPNSDGALVERVEGGAIVQGGQPEVRMSAVTLAGIDIPGRIDSQEHSETILEGADLPLAGEDAFRHLIECGDGYPLPVQNVEIEQLEKKSGLLVRGDRVVGIGLLQRRHRSVDGERNLFAYKKARDVPPILPTGPGEGGDAADVKPPLAGPLDAGHCFFEIPDSPLQIVNGLGAVQAGADGHAVLFEDGAESVVQHPEVALDTQVDWTAGKTPLESIEETFEKLMPGDERLPAMKSHPNLVERVLLIDSFDEIDSLTSRSLGHLRSAVRAEAIPATGGALQRRNDHEERLMRQKVSRTSKVQYWINPWWKSVFGNDRTSQGNHARVNSLDVVQG